MAEPKDAFLTQAQRKEKIEERIRSLYGRGRRGLWGLLLFVLISTLFALAQQFVLYDLLSQQTRTLLGKPPSHTLISIALAVYSFSALVIILARMAKGPGIYKGWPHLGYLTVFYLFYWAGNSLEGNFWAVFMAGITILGLEHYHTWAETQTAIRKEKELLQQFVRSTNPSS